MKACHAQNLELSVAIVAYTIAPAGVYPLQLRQAVSALRYLTETAQIAPSDVSQQVILQPSFVPDPI